MAQRMTHTSLRALTTTPHPLPFLGQVENNESDLNELLASVGLLDPPEETALDPFAGLSREDITASLREWRQKFALLATPSTMAAAKASSETQSRAERSQSPRSEL